MKEPLSECTKCGGHISLGPDARNTCEKCGASVFDCVVDRAFENFDANMDAHVEKLAWTRNPTTPKETK